MEEERYVSVGSVWSKEGTQKRRAGIAPNTCRTPSRNTSYTAHYTS